ncbi:PREDICTED: U-box domain-containing protein 33-like [Lupinus angustifolius]|uniref:U-box domain-containing protein 33-like n=1 Tax=Lupinus angustifolius TaxID=3871 RepID=UPI00092F324F|nr:PREDICTED: U-box domain-containing protein 33-like [Lupinus angustifolius]
METEQWLHYYYSDCDDEETFSFNGLKMNDSDELFEINIMKEEKMSLDTIIEEYENESSTVFSLDIHNWIDAIYVAVDDHGDSSLHALSWALKHVVTPSTTLFLIHVFPQIKFIPTPLGKIPRSHVHPDYVNMYLTQERGKRKFVVQNFIHHLCLDSKVKVEIMLIEGDNVAKAIVDIVGTLNIRKLVIGTTKANLNRNKSESGRGNGIGEKVVKNAQESCDVKIICEGREVSENYIIRCNSSSFADQLDHSSAFHPLLRFLSNLMSLFRSRHLSPT